MNKLPHHSRVGFMKVLMFDEQSLDKSTIKVRCKVTRWVAMENINISDKLDKCFEVVP